MAFRLSVSPTESHDRSGDFEDWYRRMLSYLSLDNTSYPDISHVYLVGRQEAQIRQQMSVVRDNPQLAHDSKNQAKYVALVLFNVLLQMTRDSAYVLTSTTLDDNGSERLPDLLETTLLITTTSGPMYSYFVHADQWLAHELRRAPVQRLQRAGVMVARLRRGLLRPPELRPHLRTGRRQTWSP